MWNRRELFLLWYVFKTCWPFIADMTHNKYYWKWIGSLRQEYVIFKKFFSKMLAKSIKIFSLLAPPSGKFKGYNSNQSEFRIVITLKAAEPMAVWILMIRKHAYERQNILLVLTLLIKKTGKCTAFLFLQIIITNHLSY